MHFSPRYPKTNRKSDIDRILYNGFAKNTGKKEKQEKEPISHLAPGIY
jgi:hypothetical protein